MGAAAEHGRDHSLDGKVFPGRVGVENEAGIRALRREYREISLATEDKTA
jgi:hypothetical protein